MENIKKGWQNIEQTMTQHLNYIKNQIKQRFETIQSTYSKTSVQSIKQKLSTEKVTGQQIEKYVNRINTVNRYQLNETNTALLYTKMKQKVLKSVFDRAASQIRNLMTELQQKSTNLDFGSLELQDYIKSSFVQNSQLNYHSNSLEILNSQAQPLQNRNKWNQHTFQNANNIEFQQRGYFFTDEQSEQQFHRKLQQQLKNPNKQQIFQQTTALSIFNEYRSYERIQQNLNGQLSISILEQDGEENQQQNRKQNAQEIQSNSSLSFTPANFKIVIKNDLQSQADQSITGLKYPLEQTHFHSRQKLLYRNIVKLRNDFASDRQYYEKNSNQEYNIVRCCRKQSLDLSIQQLQELEKSRKLTKLNQNHKCIEYSQQKIYKQKIQQLFQDLSPSSNNSNSQSEQFQIQNANILPKANQHSKSSAQIQNNIRKSIRLNKKLFQRGEQRIQNEIYQQKHQRIQQRVHQKQKKHDKIYEKVSEQHLNNQNTNRQSDQNIQFIKIQKKTVILPKNHQNNKQLYFPNVQIYGNNVNQIYDSLTLIDVAIVKKLQIYCDTTLCCVDDECIDIICKMKNLKSLMIYMTNQLDKQQAKRMIKSLVNLEELVLSSFNQVDIDVAQCIRDNLPNLRRFYSCVDNKNYMQKTQQNYQFFVDLHPKPTSCQILQILADIPRLQTVQILNANHKSYKKIPRILQKMKNLKEVTITNTNNYKSNSALCVQYLANSKHSLTMFCAQNTTFKQDDLVSIIKKSKQLKTVILNECIQFKNSTIATLSKTCAGLQQLSLMLIDSIQGRQIYTFKKLRTLVLRGCWKTDPQCFAQNIHKLQNLQYLSVSYNNYWLYDRFMSQIVKLSKLKYLNIDTTKVTDMGLKDIHKLSHLQTLICGKTQITFQGLTKSLYSPTNKSKNYNIRKLGLSKDQPYTKQLNSKSFRHEHDIDITQFHAKHLIALGKALPRLTHLSIGGFINPKKQFFQTLTNLKCLSITKKQLTTQTENWLVNNGVSINEDFC